MYREHRWDQNCQRFTWRKREWAGCQFTHDYYSMKVEIAAMRCFRHISAATINGFLLTEGDSQECDVDTGRQGWRRGCCQLFFRPNTTIRGLREATDVCCDFCCAVVATKHAKPCLSVFGYDRDNKNRWLCNGCLHLAYRIRLKLWMELLDCDRWTAPNHMWPMDEPLRSLVIEFVMASLAAAILKNEVRNVRRRIKAMELHAAA